jgi:hypothetical protein
MLSFLDITLLELLSINHYHFLPGAAALVGQSGAAMADPT